MSDWECGVCGYVHKEGQPPEVCPVCEAPAKMFKELTEKTQGGTDPESAPAVAEPESAPDVAAQENTAVKRWRCTVCGYVHTGDEPPEKCPVCDAPREMFVEIDADGKALGEVETEEADSAMALGSEAAVKQSSSFLDKLASLSLKLHLHPITTHFPNGILPVVVVFLGLSVYFKIISLELAAYYNLIFVLIMLPLVLLTGFIEWQKRYKGIKTTIFIVKIICSLIVLGTVNVLVFWRLLDPDVMAEGSPSRLIYLGVALGMLGATGLAGHLGGKLVFGARG
jgi:rubredoxin